MDPVLAVLLGLLVGAGLGWVAGVAATRSRRTAADCGHDDPQLVEARHAAQLSAVRAEEQRAHAELRAELSGLEATAQGLRQQVATAQLQYRELYERVHADERARAERERVESRVLQALSPVQETLRTMQKKVSELESQRERQHGELAEQLKSAAESDERLRATAESLASALRNNSTRGVWGETQLRNVVEAAGLTNRVDFVLQSSITTDAGAGRPDMIVRLPGGKAIAVDSKVPYNSYLEASRIPATATGEDEARRRSLLAQHAKQVKSHIDALAGKRYWEGLDASPEFTVAFIPSESLLAAALEEDPLLLEYAFSRRIALASPVNLWAVLKTVALTWQQDVLTEDAKRLFDLSKELYSRLATLGEHADKLRRSIDSTVTHWNRFASSLETRVLVTARKLDELDPSKVLGEQRALDSRPTPLSAGELDYADDSDLPELEATPTAP
ncbi:DNA recombination protein RmuC [Herbiconiux sp. SYSU D00978]|uniref:DNA recombination protein RmuC n=1 Tax=Herbiconiux sp. SYSU D00978 TaxID=2812562 RepID=UPI001A96A1C0|nr:DNA recombination protein RmuC [Herbiconiux sp. SYSU D00978]